MLARLGLGNRHQEKLLPQGTRPGQPQVSGSQCLRRAAVAHRHHCPCSGSWQPGGLEEAPTPPARPPANTPRRVRVKGRVPTISSQVSGTPEALERGAGPGDAPWSRALTFGPRIRRSQAGGEGRPSSQRPHRWALHALGWAGLQTSAQASASPRGGSGQEGASGASSTSWEQAAVS